MAPRLAWIGLGNMGRGMCKNLVEKGNLSDKLILYNRSSWRAKQLSETLGASKTEVASSIESAVSSADILFTCVGDDSAMRETIDAALKADVAGKLFVDCSTVHPDTTQALDRLIRERKADFVACPIFGAPAMADTGQLIM
jgi:3-hydroxyisobutyrate dehydrogenase-like beta-hydroxyacid dehydrogenase